MSRGKTTVSTIVAKGKNTRLSPWVTVRQTYPPEPDAVAPPPIMMAPLSPSVVVPELKVITPLAPDVVSYIESRDGDASRCLRCRPWVPRWTRDTSPTLAAPYPPAMVGSPRSVTPSPADIFRAPRTPPPLPANHRERSSGRPISRRQTLGPTGRRGARSGAHQNRPAGQAHAGRLRLLPAQGGGTRRRCPP